MWAGDAVNIQLFHHLTPFEQQRASLLYLEKNETLDMASLSSEIYEVLNEKELKEGDWLRFYDKGIGVFHLQQWSRAMKYFNEALCLKNDDLTSRTYKHISAKCCVRMCLSAMYHGVGCGKQMRSFCCATMLKSFI